MADRFSPHHYAKTVAGFVPVSQAAKEFHAKTKIGQRIELKGRRPRNPGHHRKLFALLALLADNRDEFSTTDDALLGLKAVLGYGDWKKLHPKAEREVFVPSSIAFENMGQDEFNAFYESAIAAVRRWWLSVEESELKEAVEGFAA
jgi:hypothetical protein